MVTIEQEVDSIGYGCTRKITGNSCAVTKLFEYFDLHIKKGVVERNLSKKALMKRIKELKDAAN